MTTGTPELQEQLELWRRHVLPNSQQVLEVGRLPGNAGLVYRFNVLYADHTVRPLVIRLAPQGVRRSGATDVLRQVPLLRHLQLARLDVPRLIGWGSEPNVFGTDFLIQTFVDGKPLHMWDRDESVLPASEDTTALVRRAVGVLARLHKVDVAPLSEWSTDDGLYAEIRRWEPLIERAPEPTWKPQLVGLVAALTQSVPDPVPGRLVHGDFQTNNVLFDKALNVAAVIDWELAGIGDPRLDLAWLSMFLDPSCFAEEHQRRMRVLARPEWLRDSYEEARGLPVTDFDWFRALACFRFATIASFNLYLNRSGRRRDSFYESLATSVPRLIEMGSQLVNKRR